MKLQSIDRELDALERAKGDLPARVQELQSELDARRNELAQAEERLMDMRKQKGLLEMELKKLQEDKKKYEEQLYSVTTNREYDAVTQEIDTTKEKIDATETSILQLIEDEENTQNLIAGMQEELQALQQKHTEQAEALEKKIQANAETEARLLEERKQTAKHVKIEFLRRYERIRGHKDGLAVVPVVRGACGGCFTQIPPQRAMEVRDGDKIIDCESCGRILIWQEKEAAAAV